MVGRVEEDSATVQQQNISSQFRLPIGGEQPTPSAFDLQHAAGEQWGMHHAGRDKFPRIKARRPPSDATTVQQLAQRRKL
jgi:hypothetical protein